MRTESKTHELIAVLAQLALLLEGDGEMHWCAWMRHAKARLEGADVAAIDYLLGAYGGMGSFNDFVAGQTTVAGQFAWKPGYAELNSDIDALRSRAWRLATEIKGSSDR